MPHELIIFTKFHQDCTVADWVLIIGLKISHFFATALILKACIEQEIQLGCYQMNTVTPKDT